MKAITIRMTESIKGSPDGIAVNTYEAGQSYEVPTSLATVFLEQGWGKESKPKKKKPAERRTKNLGAAPENKGKRR